ncbi:MAG: hypothetical protein AB7G23_14010 [Vicinamibacterales bacterium]
MHVARFVLAGLLSVVVAGVLMSWAGSLVPRPPVRPSSDSDRAIASLADVLARAADAPATPAPGWQVTSAMSAHGAIVFEVESRESTARDLEITAEIVKPLEGKYEEVLVYFRGPEAPAGASSRRVQWTPRGGFVTTQIAPP